jgi:hypothetical protein
LGAWMSALKIVRSGTSAIKRGALAAVGGKA